MPYYTYGYCVYFNNNIDAPREHHNQFILNQGQDFYITSLSNLMDGILKLLPKLFVNKVIKMCMKVHVKVVAWLSKVVK